MIFLSNISNHNGDNATEDLERILLSWRLALELVVSQVARTIEFILVWSGLLLMNLCTCS